MSVFVLADVAYEDLQRAAEHLDAKTGSTEAGTRLIEKLEGACARIAAAPYLGRLRPSIEPDLRSFAVGNYVIYYNIYPQFVEIVRILHQRQMFEREFGLEEEPGDDA